MSRSERHRRSKRFRSLCAACQERKAKFRYRRAVRADRDHTLCFEWRPIDERRMRSISFAHATQSERSDSAFR